MTFTRLLLRNLRFHGLRHTCASLMLGTGENWKIIQERLGHAKASTTMDIYMHAAPGMQQQAAQRLGVLLHG